MNFVTPAGFRDVIRDEARRREAAARRVQDLFDSRGFDPIETPTLEVLDVLQAGGRIPGTPFKFFDSCGDLLAIRPDVTLQVARMCATRMKDSTEPLRLRYKHRVFREADTRLQAASREFTQMGIECIGSSGPAVDAEVIGLLAETLRVCGVESFTLSIGTVGVLRALLDGSNAPTQWREAVLQAYHTSNFVDLEELCNNAPVEPSFASAIVRLPQIRGGREAIGELRSLLACTGVAYALDSFQETYELLAQAGLADSIVIDFSIMSSFDYYTGIVVEAYAPGLGSSLGGGGRYDNMLAAYGESRPAAGFAFSLEQVLAAQAMAEGRGVAAAGEREGAEAVAGVEAAEGTEDAEGAEVPACLGAVERLETAERPLRIAVPKGSLNSDTVACLQRAGLDTTGLDNPGRQLVISNPGVDYIIVRPTDAPAFVELGAADCGICGKDSLLEADPDVVELVDLKFGACRFIVAEPAGATAAVEEHYRRLGSIRVATKYPNITRAYYAKEGTQVEVVKLHGNIELAPLTGMAERIVDITATGTTLRENNLAIVDEVLSSTARFFANTCAFRTDMRIKNLAAALAEVCNAEGEE